MGKKLYIKTYGCQMNVYDSALIGDLLAPLGYAETNSADDADMVILNTCHIREKATEKLFSELGRLRRQQRKVKEQEARDVSIVVAGCVAQAESEEIARRAPWIDLIAGPQTYHTLPELISTINPSSRNAVINTDFPIESKFDFLPTNPASRGPSAFLSVQEGCDKFCTFCVVPYTRGAEFSRPATAILAEARALIADGTREITLLGQNVNAWRGEAPDASEWSLGRLLYALAEIDGLMRIRYTTSHPLDMHDALFDAHAEIETLMPCLHLPVQSGSDRILDAMNRRHRRDDYIRIIDRMRSVRPEIAISGDFIIGFPGETDRDFADTVRLIDQIGYASAYSFKYSPRPGTPAASAHDQVPDDVQTERLAAIQQLLAAQQLAFNRTHVGETVDVLIESRVSKRKQMTGRTPWMQNVYLDEALGEIGAILPVTITAAHQNSLGGKIVIEQG